MKIRTFRSLDTETIVIFWTLLLNFIRCVLFFLLFHWRLGFRSNLVIYYRRLLYHVRIKIWLDKLRALKLLLRRHYELHWIRLERELCLRRLHLMHIFHWALYRILHTEEVLLVKVHIWELLRPLRSITVRLNRGCWLLRIEGITFFIHF